MLRGHVGLGDLDFDRKFLRVVTRNGRVVQRWSRIGLPRVPERFESAVVFMFGQHPERDDVLVGPGGTGVLIMRPSSTLMGENHIYVVSNKHVIDQTPWVRINTNDAGTRLIERISEDWTSDGQEDLAILDVTDEINDETDFYSWVWHDDLLTTQHVWGHRIGIGDQVFMLGLFADHDGSSRNLPVARFGSIAAMPNPLIPVATGPDDLYKRPAFLNDMRSRQGFSGSPVWVWRSQEGDLSDYNAYGTSHGGMAAHFARPFLCFAGIHREQFPERTRVLLSKDENLVRRGTELTIANAMTIVIPAWEISRLMDNPQLCNQRDVRDSRTERIDRAAKRMLFKAEE